MKVLENKLHDIIDKYLFHIGIIILIIASLLVRWHLAPICVLSADYNNFIVPWVEFYREHGFAGLAQQVGDYYVPYNIFLAAISYLPWPPWIMVSLFSCAADYVSAFYIYKIACHILEGRGTPDTGMIRRKAIIAGVVSVFLPITFLNSALWKQCDGIYVCLLIVSLYLALKEKYGKALILLGVSLCFKLQAIFLLPFFILLYIGRKEGLRIWHFMYLPLMYLVGGLPAILAGRRITNVYGTYYRQMNHEGYDAMTLNFPNIYGLGLSDYPALQKPMTVITACIFILFAIFLQRYIKLLDRVRLSYVAIWCVWTCSMFLPGMHERYGFAAVLLISVFYFAVAWKKLWVAVVLNLISIVTYSSYLFEYTNYSLPVLSIFHILAYGYVTYDLIISVKGNLSHEKFNSDVGEGLAGTRAN